MKMASDASRRKQKQITSSLPSLNTPSSEGKLGEPCQHTKVNFEHKVVGSSYSEPLENCCGNFEDMLSLLFHVHN